MATKTLPLRFFAGLAGLAAASALLALDWAFMRTWYYVFAWWSFILIMDGINARRDGMSPLKASPADFLFLAFVSIPVWLVFELFNLRLRNWSYHGLPESGIERWAGYALAFATVLPALEELAAFFGGLYRRRESSRPRPRLGRYALRSGLWLGVVLLALPLAWPRLFFPLVWLGFIFLLEPLNARLGAPGPLRDLAEGRAAPVLTWLSAGLAAGFLWEFWNWWSGSHWEYAIPLFDFGRLFQMPVLGFLGFPAFALEAWGFIALFRALRDRARRRPALLVPAVLLLAAFDLAAFALIDRFSLVR